MVLLCENDEEVSLDVEDELLLGNAEADRYIEEGNLVDHHNVVDPDSWVRDLPTSSTSIEAFPHVQMEVHYHLHDVSWFLTFHLVLLDE